MKTEGKLSPTVESVRAQLENRNTVSTWEIVKAILERHREYGEHMAREVASGPEPETGRTKDVDAWLGEVADLFDPELVPRLHGRLVILGLCQLDESLSHHLRGFNAALKQELREDFDALLRPTGADKYKHEFLVTLQNRGKLAPKAGPARDAGFLFVVSGGPGLKPLEQICHRQNYAYCFTARYVLPAGSPLRYLLNALVADLRGVLSGDRDTIGTLLPQPTVDPFVDEPSSWHDIGEGVDAVLKSTSEGSTDIEILDGLLSNMGSILDVGKRLVLLVEWRGAGASVSGDMGFDEQVVRRLASLPERVGIVLSGLPQDVASRIHGAELVLPADLALTRGQPMSNDVPEGPDRLGIAGEVGALAEAIALKEMQPPLVVGVLGGWGSGKSFVLHLLEERLHEIRCERIEPAEGERFPFVGHPYVIRFDAWTFAKGDLWASLMQTILEEFDRQLTLEKTLSEELGLNLRESTEVWRLLGHATPRQTQRLLKTEQGRRALEIVAAMEGAGTSGQLWATLGELNRAAKQDLVKKETELRDLEAKLAAAELNLESVIDEEIEADARRAAWAPIRTQVEQLVQKSLGDAPTFDGLLGAVSVPKRLFFGLRNLSLPAAVFVVLPLCGGIAIALSPELRDGLRWVGGAAGVAVAALAPLARAHEWLEARRREYGELFEQAQQSKALSRDQRRQVALAAVASDTPAARVKKFEGDLQAKRGELQALRLRVGIASHEGLGDFVKNRLESGLYEEKLGLLHQIQADIAELSETLLPSRAQGTVSSDNLAEVFPRGVPRVVLLIDDLDRCPPDKVVEVFEAAQLLVKTELFVVVMAMDVRYVTRALEAEYDGVLVRNGEPSGLDYIEKIIQIPYRVRAGSVSAIRSFLRFQMGFEETKNKEDADPNAAELRPVESSRDTGKEDVDEGRAPASPAVQPELSVLPTEVLNFESDEDALISSACVAVEVSPRAMKRLVNVFKLLKIIWYRRGLGGGPDPPVKQAMLSLLVLAARYPEVVRQLLAAMESAYRGRVSPGGKELATFLAAECPRRSRTALYPPDWDDVGLALMDEQFFPKELTFSEFEETNLHLVSSFSFVGETDSEREAALKRGYYQGARQSRQTEASPEPSGSSVSNPDPEPPPQDESTADA